MPEFKTDMGFTIVTPQFERPKSDAPAASSPATAEDWAALHGLSKQALKELGFRCWDEADAEGYELMLLPGEWYERIPAGFEITSITGETEAFEPGVTDNDIRYGCLAYGIRVKVR